jgi:hypothetical protein
MLSGQMSDSHLRRAIMVVGLALGLWECAADTIQGPASATAQRAELPAAPPLGPEPTPKPANPGPPIPTDRWLALPHGAGTMGWGEGAVELKHTWAESGPDNRVYFHAGDFSGDGRNQSNRQDLWSFDLLQALGGPAGAGWALEHPYCVDAPHVQPKHPDKVAIAWDARRGVFWAVPGLAEVNTQASDNCPGETARRASDPRFPWHAVMFWSPATKRWTLYDPNPGPGFIVNGAGGYEDHDDSTYSIYDAASDSLVRFARGTGGLRALHYRITTRTYRSSAYFGDVYINQNYLAHDPLERAVYVIDAVAGLLYRYDVGSWGLQRVAAIPGGRFPQGKQEWPLVRFDTRNRVVLFYRMYPPRGFFAYNLKTKKWETLSLATTVPGVEAHGLMLWYDASLNYIGLMGGTPVERDTSFRPTGNPPGTRYLFVTRYPGTAAVATPSRP